MATATSKKPPVENSESLYINQLKFDPKLRRSPMAFLLGNARILVLALISLVLAGVYSFQTLPRELNPEVNIPIVSVGTALPGANPLDVETLITEPIEQEVVSVTNVKKVTSNSTEGFSSVVLEFNSGVDPDKALADTKEKVDLVTDLPEDATVPRVQKLDFNDQPVLLVAVTGQVDTHSLSRLVRELADDLETDQRIKRVDLIGVEEQEITIDLNPTTLQNLGITAQTVLQAISAADVKIPAGTVTVNQTEYQLSVDNDVTTIQLLRDLVIAVDDDTVRLGEIADIYFQAASDTSFAEYVDTEQNIYNAVQLAVYKSENATIVETADTANEKIAEYLEEYPQFSSVVVTDYSADISEEFETLGANFRDTIILVFLTLLLFIGFRQASIASLSIPLTFLSAFIIMNLTGITLNFLSLFSLLLALGLVVDDAIVIVQAVHRYSQKFTDPMETGLLVFRDFVIPIWTTTLTTVWAFLPLLLATGILGEFIKSIPIVVSATLLSSTTVAVLLNLPFTVLLADVKWPQWLKTAGVLAVVVFLTVIFGQSLQHSQWWPAWLLLWLVWLGTLWLIRSRLGTLASSARKRVATAIPKSVRNYNFAEKFQSGFINFDVVVKRYRNLLYRILKRKRNRWMVYLSVVIFTFTSIGFVVTGLLPAEFFPATDLEYVYVGVEGPPGWPEERTVTVLNQVRDEVIEEVPEYSELFIETGSSVPLAAEGGSNGPHTGFVTINLPNREARDRSSIEIAEHLRGVFDGFNQAKISVIELDGGPPAGADLQVNIFGSDLEVLEEISQEFIARLEAMPEAINVDTSLKQSPGQIKIDLNAQELAERGLTPAEVGSWLRTAVTGTEATTIQIDDEEVEVQVRLADSSLSLSTLRNIVLPTRFGSYQLAEVADFNLETSPTSIEREDETRVVRVTAAANDVAVPELLAEFEEQVESYELPIGYYWTVGGANEENQESTQSIVQAMGISIVLILLTMVLQLNSFRKSSLVLMVIPLAVAGVIFNFTLFRIPLSFPALIGVLALFGIVVNNAIMLVDKINQNLQIGLNQIDSVVDACSSRIEAIFFTSLTTTMGLLPITISDPLWRGLGGAIIAGLSVSGTLILLLLPTAYIEIYGDGSKKRKQ